jgi:hypothetical protein
MILTFVQIATKFFVITNLSQKFIFPILIIQFVQSAVTRTCSISGAFSTDRRIKKMKNLIGGVLIGVVMIQMVNISSMVYPAALQTKSTNSLQMAAIKAGIGDPGEQILNAVQVASVQTGLSKPLLLSLMWTESTFKKNAISAASYQGLMQIPFKIHYPDVNTLIGARILIEKLRITGGDYRKAIILYKGWPLNHPEGKRQADKVLNLARKLKEN